MARTVTQTSIEDTLLDTNIFATITEDGEVPVLASMGTQSTKTSGIVKLVNRFIKLLYTLKGTNYLNKDEGTYFVRIFDQNIQDTEVLQTKIQDAIDEAAEQIIELQSLQGVPDTEKFKNVILSGFHVSDDREVQITLTIEVVSGANTAVQLPSTTLGTV